MKKKFQLEELSVNSFVTELSDKEGATVEGGTILSLISGIIISFSVKQIYDIREIDRHNQETIKSQAMGRACPVLTIGGNCLTPTVTCNVTHVPNSSCGLVTQE